MAGVEDVSELGDLSKLKVADLKRELKARGLSTTGNKLELMERLQNGNTDLLLDDNGTVDEADIIDEDAMLEDGLDDDVEDEVLTPEAEKVLEEEPKLTKRKLSTSDKSTTESAGQPKKIVLVRNSSLVASEKENRQSVDSQSGTDAPKKEESSEEKKVVKLSAITMQERLTLRAQKFGPAQSDTSKKEARALRFGLSTEGGTVVPVTADKLKKRAERFGANVSSIALKVEQAEKLKARKERFGTKVDGIVGSLEDKKKSRAERFKLN